jgi:hypothetical protein
MSKIIEMTNEDRMKYHNLLLSKEATIDDLVVTWDFFMEMATWTSKIIEDRTIKEGMANKPAKPV